MLCMGEARWDEELSRLDRIFTGTYRGSIICCTGRYHVKLGDSTARPLPYHVAVRLCIGPPKHLSCNVNRPCLTQPIITALGNSSWKRFCRLPVRPTGRNGYSAARKQSLLLLSTIYTSYHIHLTRRLYGHRPRPFSRARNLPLPGEIEGGNPIQTPGSV